MPLVPAPDATGNNLRKEYGKPRETFTTLYERAEARVDTIPKEDYRKMWQNDGQVAAIVQLPKNLILGAGYQIISEGEGPELEFVENNFLNPPMLGGLRTPIDEVIEDMTYAPFEGARFYELVWKKQGSNLLLDKIAPRDNITCYPVADEFGDFNGFHQKTTFMGKTVDVYIPKKKALALIFQQAYGGLNGLSILKAAWYHWDKKHKLIFIAHLAAELQTIPPKVIKIKGGTDEERSNIETAVDEIGLQSRLTIPNDVAEIVELVGGGQQNVNILDLINKHDSQIAKSLLAQFIDLGSETSSTGSRSLGESMIDVYYKFVEGLQIKIENAINSTIISLVDYNFATQNYPHFKFNPIQDQDRELIREMFKEVVKNGSAKSVVPGIVAKVADDLGIEYNEDAVEDTSEELEQPEQPEPEEEVEMAEDSPRLLLAEERKVDFVKLQSEANRIADSLRMRLEDTIDREEIIAEVLSILNSGNISRLADLQVANKNQVISALDESMREVFEMSKVEAYNEVNEPVRPTSSDQKTVITIGATTNGSKMVEDLKSRLINIVRTNYTNGVSDEATRIALTNELSDFFDSTIKVTADQNVISTLNQARSSVFENVPGIVGYTYSAVLDSRTTEYCRSLDGKRFYADSPDLARITPPNHFNCRSILVPIMEGEDVNFETENPKAFGSLYQFKNEPALKEIEDKLTELTETSSDIANIVEQVKSAKTLIDQSLKEINGQEPDLSSN